MIEAVAAIEAQSRPVDQIVIWDDGSTDGTETQARALASRSSGRILYRRSENRGKSHALNAALAEAVGDAIWICDDDDLALPQAVERLGNALDTSGAGFAAGAHERFRDDPKTGRRAFMGRGYWPDLSEGSVLRHLLEDIFFFQNATLVRREAFESVGTFREDLQRSIDYEMFVRLATRYPVEMVDEVLFHQRKHDGARGPALGRHAADASETVWLENDRKIFAGFRETLPLCLYEALFEADDPDLLRRVALLQRACVYARRNDWDAALDDLAQAAGLDAAGPLTAIERAIGLRTMAGKHGCRAAFRAPVAGRLIGLRRQGRLGAEVAKALARGSVWRGREAMAERDLAECARVAAFIVRAGGPTARLEAATTNPGRLVERRQLRAKDYAW